MRSLPKGFTLIELLVVIAIIAILAGLLFPAVNGAMNAARKTTARNEAVQIANACTMYETEYGHGPWVGNQSEIKGDMLKALMGENPTNAYFTNGMNRKRIVFLEVSDAKPRKSGYTNGTFVDPWHGAYQFAFDSNYHSAITNAGTNKSALRKNYAVWTDWTKQDEKLRPRIRSQSYVESW